MPKQIRRIEQTENVDDMPVTSRMQVAGLDTDNYEYRWVRNTPDRLLHVRQLGYEPADAVAGGDPGSPDGKTVVGDMIIMRVSKERHEARRAKIEERTALMEAAPRERFKRAASAANVPTVDETVNT